MKKDLTTREILLRIANSWAGTTRTHSLIPILSNPTQYGGARDVHPCFHPAPLWGSNTRVSLLSSIWK